jgi:uncharacterized protein YozE (UPF0346 family)
MRYRAPQEKDDETRLANLVFHDSAFPRQSKDYHEVSNYLETSSLFYFNLSVFDRIWQDYIDETTMNHH